MKTSLPISLQNLLIEKYSNEANLDFYLKDAEIAYSYCQTSPNIKFIPLSIKHEDKIKAHVALIMDSRLENGTAFFGFFETENDSLLVEKLWSKLIEAAKIHNVSVLKGPVNGSIWHQYRCIKETDGSSFFKTEMFSKLYYYNLLKSLGPNLEVEYYSARRKKFEKVLSKIKINENKLTSNGFRVEITNSINFSQLIQVAHLSKSIFSDSWGYTELTKDEFLNLYSSKKIKENLDKLYLLYKNELIIGYCSTIRDSRHTLIGKTICLLPKFQGLGLGNALAYYVHKDALKSKYDNVIYALMRKENKMKNFPVDDLEIFRRYSAFEFKI